MFEDLHTPLFIGNEQAVDTVRQFFRAFTAGKTSFPFLLLTGRPHVGKTTCVEQEIQKLLGPYMSSDYIPIYDLSEKLGKEQSIKIEAPRGEEYMTIDETTYCQWGIREVTQWLSRAPVGKYKIVYLENIERLTDGAAHALLKFFEEPLPGRLIIASTGSPERLLDTILSRALAIHFSLLDPTVLHTALGNAYPDFSPEKKQFLSAFSLGARGIVERLAHGDDIDDRCELFTAITDRCARPKRLIDQMQRLQWVADQGQLQQLIDALLYTQKYNNTLLVRIKQLLDTNVGQENILFWRCLETVRQARMGS